MPFLRRRLRWILAGALVFAALTKLVEWTTEAWFFDSVGQIAVYQRMMSARAALFVLGVAWGALVLGVNLRHARRVAARHRAAPAKRLIPLRDKRLLDRHRRFWGGATLLIALLLCGSYAAAHWLVVLRLFAASPTGIRDPIFADDTSFYLFTLPALNFVWTFANATLWLGLAATALFYVYEEVIETAARHWQIADEGLRHLAALGVALLLWKSAGYRLSAWNLLTARGAPFGGFDWTALHVRLPIFALLAALALTTAWLLHRCARRCDAVMAWRVMLFFVAANFALGTLLPFAVRTLYVAPRRSSLEAPILQLRCDATATAFGLDIVKNWPRKPATDAEIRAVAAGFPAWHEDEVLHYLNAHERRGDYIFTSLHFDVCEISGESRPVFVAARERLSDFNSSDDWRNAHGFGAVLCDAVRRTPDGTPLIYPVRLAHPEIVFGELPEISGAWPPDAALPNNPLPDVMTRRFQTVEAADYALLPPEYHGKGGVALDTSWHRRLLAWRFADRRLLQASDGTRVAWHRRVVERCMALAPFLLFEEPHLVITKSGRLVWLLNAHSVADSYPLSEPLTGTRLNALRCAAVVTVDAFEGSVSFFAADTNDLMLAAYRRLFPTLFHDWNTMPDELRGHLLYSSLLFSAQSDLWARLLAPTTGELIKGQRWQTAVLFQPAHWQPKLTIPLSSQSSLSPDGLLISQLFTRPQSDKEAVLNGPIAGMLLARLEPGAEYRPALWQWRPPTPIELPFKNDSDTSKPKETIKMPQSLLAAPIGDTLLLRYAETHEDKFGGERTERQTWLLTSPKPQGALDDDSFAQGNTLDETLAAWWLRQAPK